MVARVEWTRETVVDALRQFHHVYGRWPKASEWQASESLRGSAYPSYSTTASLCGSWQDALRLAAGDEENLDDPEPVDAPDPEPNESSLADLAVELAAAHRARASADDRYRRAVEAFTEHEIVREITAAST